MPVVARSSGCPDPLPIGATAGFPTPVPPWLGLAGCPASVSRAGPRSGFPARGPGAVHADPVTRVIVCGTIESPPRGSSWGAPSQRRPDMPRRPWPAVARRLGSSRHAPPLAASGCPVTRRCGAMASRPARTRSRLVGRERFPPPAARRPPSKDSVSRPRFACALRYEAYLREHKTPGQAVFLKSQGYPLNFFLIPRIHPFVHQQRTGCPQRTPRSSPVHTAGRRRRNRGHALTLPRSPG